jgi:hypothetical protein
MNTFADYFNNSKDTFERISSLSKENNQSLENITRRFQILESSLLQSKTTEELVHSSRSKSSTDILYLAYEYFVKKDEVKLKKVLSQYIRRSEPLECDHSQGKFVIGLIYQRGYITNASNQNVCQKQSLELFLKSSFQGNHIASQHLLAQTLPFFSDKQAIKSLIKLLLDQAYSLMKKLYTDATILGSKCREYMNENIQERKWCNKNVFDFLIGKTYFIAKNHFNEQVLAKQDNKRLNEWARFITENVLYSTFDKIEEMKKNNFVAFLEAMTFCSCMTGDIGILKKLSSDFLTSIRLRSPDPLILQLCEILYLLHLLATAFQVEILQSVKGQVYNPLEHDLLYSNSGGVLLFSCYPGFRIGDEIVKEEAFFE